MMPRNIIVKVVLSFLAVFFLKTQLWAADSVPQIFLIQNSGWMLPFYDDPSSRLKELVGELSARIQKNGGANQIIASFNQSIGDNISPKLHYRGSEQSKIIEAIKSIGPAKKPGKSSYADTDFREAIIGAITDFSPGQACILWIVTNNKNSPDNSTETAEKNKEFYHFLQNSPEIKRIVAYPYSNKVQSQSQKNYQANGLMIYALAYGDQADLLLQNMLSKNLPFGSQTARLKPLNSEALTFIPKGVVENSNVKATITDQKTLVLSFDTANKPETAEIVGQFRNDFFPYDIHSANISIEAEFQGGKEGISSQLSTNSISTIPAGGLSPDINVKISVPSIPSLWSPEVILGSGYMASGVINFKLSDQQLEISKTFTSSMSELFPNDPLPDLFIPGESAKSSVTTQPMLIQVVYPAWPLFLIGALAILFLGLLIASVALFRREKIYRVSIDGTQKTYALRPFKEVIIKNSAGERVGVLKRGLGKAATELDRGKNCNLRLM